MNSEWAQFLAAILAAIIPVVVKLLNDWADRLKPAETSAHDPA